MVLKRFGWIDVIIIATLVGGIVYSIRSIPKSPSSMVTVYRDSAVIAEYPLSQDKTFTVMGREGVVVIEIEKKNVSVIQSSCRHQLCVRSGAIRNAFGQIICAPNHLLISITSQQKNRSDINAIAR